MKTIKLEIPNDDALAIHYLGEALVNMAYHREHGKPREVVQFEQQIGRASHDNHVKTLDIEGLEKASRDGLKEAIENDTTSGHVQLPWDERIHSGNKTQNQDGSWKMRKKPKDMTAAEWQEYIESVEAELTTLMSIPVETVVEAKQDLSMEKIAFDEEKFKKAMEIVNSDQPEVVVPKPETVVEYVDVHQVDVTVSLPETVNTPPPAEPPVVVVPKPQDVTPPPPPVTDVVPVGNTQDGAEVASGMTFVQLVQKMSSICNGDSDKSARIKEAIKEKYDVDFPALLKRPDLIPQVAAFLETVEV